MTSHDLDPRYVEQDAKARVAALYLPILGIVMDTIPQLHQYLPETHDRIQNIGFLEDYQGPHGTLNRRSRLANCWSFKSHIEFLLFEIFYSSYSTTNQQQ